MSGSRQHRRLYQEPQRVLPWEQAEEPFTVSTSIFKSVFSLVEEKNGGTYSSNSSRCSMGIVSSNTLKKRTQFFKQNQTNKPSQGKQGDEDRTNTEDRFLHGRFCLSRKNSCWLNRNVTFVHTQSFLSHSLFVDGEAGNRTVSCAGGCSQHLPARGEPVCHYCS